MDWSRGLCTRCDFLVRQSLLNTHQPALRYALPPVIAASRYEYESARCILAFKNGGRTDLTEYFATALWRALATLCVLHDVEGEIILVPAPSSFKSLHRRGYEPADELTRALLAKLKRAEISPNLEFSRQKLLRQRSSGASSQGQKLLGVAARRKRSRHNIALARSATRWFGLEPSLAGRTCVLVDDVVTTGATLGAMTKVLQGQGLRVLGAVTVAAVPTRNVAKHEGNTQELLKRHIVNKSEI